MSTITQFPSGNTQYRIEFDYLARTFVVVTLVNSSNPAMNRVLEVGRDYRFLNPTMIEMLVDQSGFDIVSIHRQTGTDLVVDFRNGSVLTASDLTNSELQAIHIAEEGRDQTVDLAKEYADAAGSSAGNAKDSEDEARRIAASIKESGLIGYITSRSFEKGFNVTTWNEVLLWEEDGDYYRWDGTLPKNVPAGSTPETSGGIGRGAWVSVGDASLRSEISGKTGLSTIGKFSSIADLRNFDGYLSLINGSLVKVASYYDGYGYGGGIFRWDATSADADDGGYTIKPTGNAGTGRWKREFVAAYLARTVSPLEFGAKMNYSTFDSAPAINAAISYLNPYLDTSYDSHQGGDVIFPAGQYYINDTIYGAPNVRLIGTGGTTGFRYSRAGCAIIISMSTMDNNKVQYDTAPYKTDGTGRYTDTSNVDNAQYITAGYYGQYLENLVFLGNADQKANIRILRVPTAKLYGVGAYGCRVSFWITGSWGTAVENCFAQGAKYATFLTPHTTALNIVGGYYTGNTSQTWAMGTAQWFHRAGGDSNRPNIAYVTTFLYAHDSVDINMHGVTWEGYYRDFALFYCGNVNIFGGYNENSLIPSSEYGHTVWAHCVASRLNAYGVFLNHGFKDFAVQSGNIVDSGTGLLVNSEISNISVYDPRVDTKFLQLTKDLGYGAYNIYIGSKHPITQDLSVTLAAFRNYKVQCDGLLDQYTMRIPNITPNGTTSFSFTINNLIAAGDYEVHFILRNANTTVHQDIRFNMLIGGGATIVSNYEARSRVGTATFPAPTVTYDNAGTATVTFQGNSGNYSVYRVKCVPRENQPLYVP